MRKVPEPDGLIGRLLQLDAFERLRTKTALDASPEPVFDKLLRGLCLTYHCSDADLARLPREGPAVVVANHPSGMADGLILGSLLARVRPDVRYLANSMLLQFKEVRDYVIPVDPFGGPEAARANLRGLRDAMAWLKAGHMLAMFPSGEVSAMKLPEGRITEPAWSDTAARLIRMSKAPVVPVFLDASNSPAFQMLGLIHPSIRTAMLPRELMNKRGATIGVAVGGPIAAENLNRPSDRENADYLRWRTELLRGRFAPAPAIAPAPIRAQSNHPHNRREVESLPPEQCLVEHGGFLVCVAESSQIPATLREIGRSREISFRAAGEGTGASCDVDVFDSHYLHLLLWDREAQCVAGGYRFAGTDRVVPRYGVQGLYTSTLFRFKRAFLDRMGTALELGRSFVLPEYQKTFWPLLLLWKGVGAYLVRNPQYRTLFGPVSISNTYSPVSRALMVAFLKAQHTHAGLAPAVRPRSRVQVGRLPGCDARVMSLLARDVDQLSATITDVEPDGKGVPVLLRQYLTLGGQIVDFNVDGSFSNALDGLIVVDLLHTNRRMLERYLGKAGAASFLAHHAGPTGVSAPESVSA